jgi:UDP-N-acetylglucosamine--N-acetylmuramyl-(pentapeptide) pyrophosphoryl-undecaprenol N-acetylglucosamine transferase
VLFVGTTRGLEARVVPAAGFALETIQVRGLKGVGPLRTLQALALLPLSFLASWRIVAGSGRTWWWGWAATRRTGRPRCVAAGDRHRHPGAERAPGVTNRILGKMVRAVFIAFEQARAAFHGGRRTWSETPCGES